MKYFKTFITTKLLETGSIKEKSLLLLFEVRTLFNLPSLSILCTHWTETTVRHRLQYG
jgi:hypothetical protein